MGYTQFAEGQERPFPVVSNRKQLLPNIIDGLALVKPEATWARVPRDSQTWLQGTRKITWREFANAINALADWLVKTIGRPQRPFQSVAYFGDWDPRYHILTIAAVKAGYKAVLPSGARGKEALLDFLEQLECKDILVSDRHTAFASDLAGDGRVNLHDMPSLQHLLDANSAHVPYTKTFSEARTDPILVLHTSGTTGQPKPLIYTQDWVSTWFVHFQEPPPKGFQSLEALITGVNMLGFTPQAHPAGFFTNLLLCVLKEMTCLYPLPTANLSVACLMDTLTHNPGTDVILTPPVILEKIASDNALVASLVENVRMVTFAGGPLSQRAGDVLSKQVRLWTMYAMGENCGPNKLQPEGPYVSQWWNRFTPHANAGFDMRLLPGTENNFECVVVRHPDPEHEQPVFKMYPQLQEWSTGDVFVRHPPPNGTAGADSWEYAHRLADTIQLFVDDPLRLTAGRTLMPLKFEQELSGNEPIAAVVVFGDRQHFPGLLVELMPLKDSEMSGVRDLVDSRVQACANILGVQIARQRIIFAEPGKALPRSAKGGIRRPAALQLYRDEIEKMYQQTT